MVDLMATTTRNRQGMAGTILIATAGRSGILYSSLELGRRLAAADHKVVYAGPDNARQLVDHHGLGFLALEPSRYDRFLEADADASVRHRLVHLRSRRQRAAASTAVSGFVAAVMALNPQLVLLDGEMHEHIIATSGTGVPMALLNTFASIWKQPGLPPAHHLVRPGVGWKGSRVGISMLWLALRLRKWRTATSQTIRRIGCDRLSILRHLSREAGFDLSRETDDSQWLIPFTYRRLPVLSLHALEFEFPHRPPDRVHYVGPMVLEDRIDRPMSNEGRAELDDLFARRRRAEGRRKIIYAGFGSVFSTDLDLLKRLVQAVADRRDWDLVITLSDRVSRGALGKLPDTVLALPWVPQLRVLRDADVCVTHGGINTIDECVSCGVPMLVYCGHETDMAGNTARVVHHGIGLAGDRRRDDPAMIRHRIERLLTEPRFGTSLSQLRRRYEAYAENRVAERTIESLLGLETGTPAAIRTQTPGGARS